MQIRKKFKFEAAHVLPYHPGRCSRLHGHSYRLGACAILSRGDLLAQPLDPARANEAKLIVDGWVPAEWIAAFPAATPVALQREGDKPANVELAVAAATGQPGRLRLSLQTHEFIGVR